MCNQSRAYCCGKLIQASYFKSVKEHDLSSCLILSWLSACRVLFFSAKPSEELVFTNLRAEAVANQDVVVLPSIWESYHNITHQTLEVLRFGAADIGATHVMKVISSSAARTESNLQEAISKKISLLLQIFDSKLA